VLFNVKKDTPQAPVRHEIQQVDRSIDNKIILNQIEGTNANYAKHMLNRNPLLEKFAKDVFGGVEILDQPVCRKCERPGMWDKGGTGYCFVCGTRTENPITVEQYYIEELKATKEQMDTMTKRLSKGGEIVL